MQEVNKCEPVPDRVDPSLAITIKGIKTPICDNYKKSNEHHDSCECKICEK